MWTMKQLKEISLRDFTEIILREKFNSCSNIYSPLAHKLCDAMKWVRRAKEVKLNKSIIK